MYFTTFHWISLGAKTNWLLGKHWTKKSPHLYSKHLAHMKTQQAKQGVIRTRHIIGSMTNFTWSWAKKHFTNQGYIRLIYPFNSIHKLSLDNKKTHLPPFRQVWPRFSISPTWRYSPTCGEHGPTTASRCHKPVRETIVFPTIHFSGQVLCYFQV